MAEKPRVLVVDDDPCNLRIIKYTSEKTKWIHELKDFLDGTAGGGRSKSARKSLHVGRKISSSCFSSLSLLCMPFVRECPASD